MIYYFERERERKIKRDNQQKISKVNERKNKAKQNDLYSRFHSFAHEL